MREPVTYNRAGLLAFTAVIAIGYTLTSRVYQFGLENHNEQFPAIIHLVDPSRYANDVLVTQNAAPGSPRYLYFRLVAGLTELIGLEAAVALLYVIGLAATIGAIYVFSKELFDDSCIALVIVATYLFPIADYISLGGNSMIDPYLIPSMVATPLVLVGFVLLLRARVSLGFVSLAAATAIHLSIGAWMTGVAILALAATHVADLDGPLEDRVVRAVQRFPYRPLALYVAISTVATAPILLANLTSGTENADFVWLVAWFRHPHHYVPSTWTSLEIARYAAVVALAAASFGFVRHLDAKPFRSRRATVFGLTFAIVPLLVMLFGGFVFTELVRVDPIIKLQPFRIDYFPVLVFVGLATKALIVGLRYLAPTLPPETVGNLVLALLIVLSIGHVAAVPSVAVTTSPPGISGVENVAHYQDRPETDRTDAYGWIDENTPQDAVIMTPPHHSTARLETGRAIVVDAKTFVFRPAAAAEWKHRLDTLCGGELEASARWGAWRSDCADGYPALPESSVRAAADEFESCWVVTTNDSYRFQERYSNAEYTVYEVTDSAHC